MLSQVQELSQSGGNAWSQVLFAVLTPIGAAVLGIVLRISVRVGRAVERLDELIRWRQRTEKRLDVIETASIEGPIRGRQVQAQVRAELAADDGSEPTT